LREGLSAAFKMMTTEAEISITSDPKIVGIVVSTAKVAFQPIGMTTRVISLRAPMKHHVIGVVGANHQIFWTIVCGILIDMMHLGSLRQLSPKSTLRDQDVSKSSVVIYSDGAIAVLTKISRTRCSSHDR